MKELPCDALLLACGPWTSQVKKHIRPKPHNPYAEPKPSKVAAELGIGMKDRIMGLKASSLLMASPEGREIDDSCLFMAWFPNP